MTSPARVYRETKKKHDQLFNVFVMRPLASVVVAAVAGTRITPNQITLAGLAVFLAAAALFVALPTYGGGLVAVAVLEASYCLDCADGMLARYKKLASKAGHLFDFFTDELKAVLLVAALSVRLFQTGGYGFYGLGITRWNREVPWWLVAGIAGTVIVASAISLTNFVRRPELSGKETTVEAHYETVEERAPTSIVGRVTALVMTFLRFLNHYPSHIFVFAAFGRLDAYLWIYIANNALYLARGWLGLVVRFGRL
jgi:phosphatidylglycerophosphate synthase